MSTAARVIEEFTAEMRRLGLTRIYWWNPDPQKPVLPAGVVHRRGPVRVYLGGDKRAHVEEGTFVEPWVAVLATCADAPMSARWAVLVRGAKDPHYQAAVMAAAALSEEDFPEWVEAEARALRGADEPELERGAP